MAKITKRFVDRLTAGPADVVHWDDALSGFGVRLKPTGAMTYVVQYRNAVGQSKRLTVGRVGVLTPEEARREAVAALAGVAKGKDPVAEKRAQRADLTVSALVELYLDEGPADKPTKKASSWTIDASNLRRHVVPSLGRRHLATLAKADVQKFQRDVTEGKTAAEATGAKKRGRIRVRGGAGTAWRATAVLSAMLAWAVGRGLRADNPAEGVQLNKLAKRERFLTDEELARLGEALVELQKQGANPASLAIVRLLLLTGARRDEIAGAKWEHVDFQRGVLLLPDSKTGAKAVPLAAPALEVLSKLPRDDRSSWVFPAARGEGHHVGVPKVWRKLRKMVGLKGVRLHDLRHTHASVGVALNQSLFIVGKILGHKRPQTTEKYAHLALDPVRAAAEQTAQRLAGALNGRQAGKLVQMRGRLRPA
jgi:integrase